MSDYNQETLAIEGQEYINSFRKKLKSIVDEVFGDAYTKIMPYIETDTFTNYREHLRLELSHEYKYQSWKAPWATNLRRAIFVENREELAQLISKDILERIKHLEDCRQEYEAFRYTPLGDTYQCLKAENEKLKKELQGFK